MVALPPGTGCLISWHDEENRVEGQYSTWNPCIQNDTAHAPEPQKVELGTCTKPQRGKCNAGIPCFIVLHSCFTFYILKSKVSTSKKVLTGFVAIFTVLLDSGTKPTRCPFILVFLWPWKREVSTLSCYHYYEYKTGMILLILDMEHRQISVKAKKYTTLNLLWTLWESKCITQ